MADGWVLIDTSAWIHALRPAGDPLVRQQVHTLLSEGRAATCEMVVLELVGGTHSESEYRELCEDLEALQQCPITESVWRSAYRMTYTLRRKGLSIPARISSSLLLLYTTHAVFFTVITALICWPAMSGFLFMRRSRFWAGKSGPVVRYDCPLLTRRVFYYETVKNLFIVL